MPLILCKLALLIALVTVVNAQQIRFGSSQNVLHRQSAEYFLKLQVDLEQQLPGYVIEHAISISNTSFATAWMPLSEYQQSHNITINFNYSLPTNVNIYAVLRYRPQGNVANWKYTYSEPIKIGDNLATDAPCTDVWSPTSGLISPPNTPSLQVYFEPNNNLVTFHLTAQYLLGGYTWVIDFQPFTNNVTAGQYGLGTTPCENRDRAALNEVQFVELWNCGPAANYSAAVNSAEYMSYWPGPGSPWTVEALNCGAVRYTWSSVFTRVSTCPTETGSPAVSYVDLTTGDVLFYGTLYATAIRPISVLDASLGYQSYANSIPFQWTYNVTKPVTPVTYAPGTLAPVGTNSTSALIIAPELLPAIIIPAVVAGVVLTLVIVVGVMARHKSTRGTVKKLFHGNKCTGARDSKKKKPSAGTTDNERAPPAIAGNVASTVQVTVENNSASEHNQESVPPMSIPKIAIGGILEMVNRNLDFAAQTAHEEAESDEDEDALEHSETRDARRSDSPVQHSPVFEKELISQDLVDRSSSFKHSPQRSTFASPVNSPKLKLSRTGKEGLRLSSVVSSTQGSSLRSSSEASARRDTDSPKSAVLWSSRNGSLVSSRQNSKKHLPRKDSNVLLSRVSEQLLEVKFNVFGRPLREHVDKNKQLPILLEELTEGLLKAAASLSQLELRQVLCKCCDRLDVEVKGVKRDISTCDFDQLSANIPVSLTLLVEYFADLPSALVPLATLTDMIEAMQLTAVPEFQFELLRSAVLSLPHSHFKVLARMCEFIHRTCLLLTDEDARNMVCAKMCYRFGLCFMQHASCLKSSAVIDGNDKIAKQVASTCHVFQHLVAHRERLFNLHLTPDQTFTHKDDALYLDTTSRDELFKLMINPHYKEQDFMEVLAFGASYLMSAVTWFTQLIECYNALGNTIAAFHVPIKLRILSIFEAWLKQHKRELVAEREAVKVLCKFLQHETNNSPHVQILVSSLNVLMLTQTKVVPLPSSSVPLLVPHLREDFSIYNFTTKEVARELCLIDWSLFKEVDPTECCHKRFMEARTGGYFFKAAERFNNVNAWVQYEVLRLTAVKDRVTFMAFLAEVASECLTMNNFSAALAIFCAFNATPIMRLKDTWQKLSLRTKKQLRELANVFSMDSNYKVYRKTLARATPPIIPYLGLCGKYLFSIEENVEALTDDGLLNMDKLYKLYYIVREIRSYQQMGYEFKSNNDLNRYLLNMVTLTEQEALEQSSKLEP